MEIEPIGVIHTPFKEPKGTPIQPRFAKGARGEVEIVERYVERVWLVYWFDRAPKPKLAVKPFLDDKERGLFATRAPCRPNPIGMSPVRLLSVEGNVLSVGDVDMLDGTPLLDIKPYNPRFDCFEVERAGWLGDAYRRNKDRVVADDRFTVDEGQEEDAR